MKHGFGHALTLCTLLLAGAGAHAQGAGGAPLPRVPFEACLDATLRTLGGRATHVEFESRQGVPTYEFVVRSGDAQYYAGCDANTGLVSRIDVIVAPDDTRWTDVAKIDPTTARNAAIERFPGGKVEEVKHLLMGDGRTAYEIDLEFDDRRQLNVYVDAVAGGIFLVTPEYWEIGAVAAPAATVNQEAVCRDGIATIDAALARNPAPEQREPLDRARRKAAREQEEREFDECLEAIDRVRPLLGQR